MNAKDEGSVRAPHNAQGSLEIQLFGRRAIFGLAPARLKDAFLLVMFGFLIIF